jgi:hypothetical protein
MQSVFEFIIRPKKERYNNTKDIGGKELILNTEMSNHLYVSREAIVISPPLVNPTEIREGDEIIVHHNVFRRFYDVYGKEKNSRNYYKDDLFFCPLEQIYMYKNDSWKPLPEYCFVEPILTDDKFESGVEVPLMGILVYTNEYLEEQGLRVGDIVGFKPGCEFEFVLHGMKLYRVLVNDITVNYGHKTNEATYNTSWTRSS